MAQISLLHEKSVCTSHNAKSRFTELHSLGLLDRTLLETVTQDLNFDVMTPIQSATLQELLQKRIDVLAQAKTGTGKTLAFLLPSLQWMISRPRAASGISILVISPTRELAIQIAQEAKGLLQRLPQYRVQCVIGGTNKDKETKLLLSGCDVMIATPGRLLDHLSDERVVYAFHNLYTLVLDEADRLLDMGFYPDLQKIINRLPDKGVVPRRSMLFSATITENVKKVAHLVLERDYRLITTIAEGEVNTHERVSQYLVKVTSASNVMPVALEVLLSEASKSRALDHGFKCIVFTPTAAIADFLGALLAQCRKLPSVSVLHARVSQSRRSKIASAFRDASEGICVATDVIARGMDFPMVSHVVQVGIPMDKESYIHRLGRTARADKEGQGVLIIFEEEGFFLFSLKGIKLSPLALSKSEIPMPALDLSTDAKSRIYQSWLGYYKTHLKGLRWTPMQLVKEANEFAYSCLKSPEIPAINKRTVLKMGLKGVTGLNVIPNEPGSNKNAGSNNRLVASRSKKH